MLSGEEKQEMMKDAKEKLDSGEIILWKPWFYWLLKMNDDDEVW